MRPVLACALALVLLSAGLAVADPVAHAKPDVGAGRVAWFDLTTTSLAKSKDFYGQLFGWTFAPVEGTNLAVEIVAGDTSIGTIRVAEGALSPFDGVVYVQVADMLATCARAKELGATIPPGFPFDLPGGRGAIGLVVDPVGHPIGVYSPTPLPAAPAAGE